MAGQRNPNAVQYHFKDKYGFISAILRDRVTRVDALRRQRFDALRSSGNHLGPRDLLKIRWLPDMTITAQTAAIPTTGSCSNICSSRMSVNIPFYKIDARSRRMSASREGNRSRLFAINKLLHQHYQGLSRKTFDKRISALSMMFLSFVRQCARARKE